MDVITKVYLYDETTKKVNFFNVTASKRYTVKDYFKLLYLANFKTRQEIKEILK